MKLALVIATDLYPSQELETRGGLKFRTERSEAIGITGEARDPLRVCPAHTGVRNRRATRPVIGDPHDGRNLRIPLDR